MPPVVFRPAVIAAREALVAGRARLAAQHRANSPGIQVSAALTDLFDEIVLSLTRDALAEFSAADRARLEAGLTFAALGSYGRAEIAPYSDVDLLILHEPVIGSLANSFVKRVIQDVYDVGLIAGQSLRTVNEAVQMAQADSSIFTAQLEARYVWGRESLFQRFERKLRGRTRYHWRSLLLKIIAARDEERAQFGETVYLLEPNVKRSPGGLRELQLLRWVGYARYGNKDPESLHLMGELHQEDRDALRRAGEFLLHIRNELHFHADKAHDILDKGEQLRIAELFGFAGAGGLLPVERFMQEYFRHTQAVRQIVSRFVEGAQPYRRLQAWFAPLVSYSLAGEFRVGPHHITATKRGQAHLQKDLSQVLRLAVLASLYNKRIAHGTWKLVRNAVARFPAEVPAAAREYFLELLANPTRLGELLHTLHELGVLEKLLPDFAHARSLLQFNEYHKYTVDEHTLKAVECAAKFADRTDALGEAYRNLRDKWLLHFALLVHDLGKGYEEDHSDVGLRIAALMAERFDLAEHDAESLKFLVHKHLLMSHLAFRRDTSDNQLVLKFAIDVGSPDLLSMLYVLTCADLSAVGPGVFNDWKCEVLTALYQRTMRQLSGDDPGHNDDQRRRELYDALAGVEDRDWFRRQIDNLPDAYLQSAPAAQLALELRHLAAFQPGEVKTWCRYLPESRTVEYTVGTHESVAAGIFHKLTGGLSSQGLQILSADIYTLLDGLILDRFVVTDPDFAAEPPQERLNQVHSALVEALRGDAPPVFRRVWQSNERKTLESLTRRPTRVNADNATSERYTILDIFANDRRGLLYTITRTLFELGLSVSLAKIGTYLDQVVDVFYLADNQGNKIEDEQQLREIKQRLFEAIQELEDQA